MKIEKFFKEFFRWPFFSWIHGKNSPALRAWFTSSKIFHAVRARITVYFKLRTRLPIFLLSEHENPALTAWKILLEVILLWEQDFFFSVMFWIRTWDRRGNLEGITGTRYWKNSVFKSYFFVKISYHFSETFSRISLSYPW